MCGITGFVSFGAKVSTDLFYRAHQKIKHRGPDDEGFLLLSNEGLIRYMSGEDSINEVKAQQDHLCSVKESSIILGHRRLSILDLTSAGHQPFRYESLHMVFNGEVYNYLELKEELCQSGYGFTTETDTEVILKSFHCWGEKAFFKFNGMWSVAIYNDKENRLFLCRDRFGIKPLYYSQVGDNLIFGSEIKFVSEFLEHNKVNESAVYDYLRYSHVDHTNETFFQGINQIPGSFYVEFSDEGLSIKRYWEISSEKTSLEGLDEMLTSAIALRMRSDVEVGSLLSGGIDSSLILALIDKKKLTENFKTFSVVFKETQYSEEKYIQRTSTNNISLDKRYIRPSANELLEQIDELIYTQEEPFRSLAVFSQFEIYKYIKANTQTVVLLNGQGADEVFTGYTEHHYYYLIQLLKEIKFKHFLEEFRALVKNKGLGRLGVIKKMVGLYLKTLGFARYDKYGVFTKRVKGSKSAAFSKDVLRNSLMKGLLFSALPEYLRYEDRNSMKFSLESRLPFLDYRLVEKGLGIANEQKILGGISKTPLRTIGKGEIDNSILDRKDKTGFVSPQELWQRTIIKKDMDSAFEEIKSNGLFSFLNSDKLYLEYQKYQDNKQNDWAFIWRVYCLYKWKKVWSVVE